MGFIDKLKEMAKITDEDYLDNTDDYRDYGSDYTENYPPQEEPAYAPQPEPAPAREEPAYNRRRVNYQPADRGEAGRVVDIHSANRSQVVFKKLDKFEDAGAVADVLNEKKIVILNLETCPNDISRRVLDFLYGVAYANNGEIKRVAGRAYIITPYNVPISGEMLDDIENAGVNL